MAKWIDQFKLTQTEKRGLYVLAFLIFIALGINLWLRFKPVQENNYNSTLKVEVEDWEAERKEAMRVPHHFDPNTADSLFVYNTTLSEFAKRNWLKFRRRNQFATKNDLLAIYGMDTLWYQVNADSIIFTQQNQGENTGNEQTPRLFAFDPNIVSRPEMLTLGFPNWLADRILNYRSNGGSFNTPEELLKIYDFPVELYQKVEPYIEIAQVPIIKEEPEVIIVDINQADSTELLKVTGIGPAYANRILIHRNRLGGFVDKEQLYDVYGVDSAKYVEIESQLSITPIETRKLKINSASFKTLLAHPYLNYEQVKSIVNYRETMGPHKNIDDLIHLDGFSTADVKRLKPYLTVE